MKVSVTDNWTLFDSVALLQGDTDPAEEIKRIRVGPDRIHYDLVPRGSIQLQALANLLTLIVLSDEIRLLETWVHTWKGSLSELDSVLGERIFPDSVRQDPNVARIREEYQAELNNHPLLSDRPPEEGSSLHRTVVRETSVYLAMAEAANATYTPHPQRARFLSETLWISDPGVAHVDRFLQLVDESRVRVSRAVLGGCVVDSAVVSMPSIPLYCLRHSSPTTNPIAVALQLHDDKAVKAFRAHMNDLHGLLARGKEATYLKSVARFPSLIQEVEKSLGIRDLDRRDGPEKLSVVRGLEVRVPEVARRLRLRGKHSGFISKLILSGVEEARSALSRSLGIRDPQLLKKLIETQEQ